MHNRTARRGAGLHCASGAGGPGVASGAGGLVVALVLVLLAAGCGGDGGGGSTPTTPAPASTAPPEAATTVVRGAPRWETVTTSKGIGPTEPPAFSILKDSIQWRARWACDTGRLLITTDPPPRRGTPLVDAACPAKGEGFAIVSGDVRIKVDTPGSWDVIADQQVDTPLKEPPFEGMATAPVLRQGSLYPIEKDAKGTARVYKRADGANVLRLEGFEVTTNVDLFVWLSEAEAPKTSADAVAAPYVQLGNLKSTIGDQSYVLPADLPPERMKSLIIWCAPIRIAYGGAVLGA